MTTVTLLGMGLMGGAIGLALKQRREQVEIRAYARRKETRDEALRRGMADAVFDDPAAAVRGASLVIACVPVCQIPGLMAQALPGLSPDAVVTDVGSTKAWLQAEMRHLLQGHGAEFVGSHPMCGSEKSGLESATPDLYVNSVCVVCSEPESRSEAWRVTRFWASLGCRVLEMDAAVHDERVAATSHMPHLAATAVVLAAEGSHLQPLIGGGFRDTTRVAAGSPAVWRDIVSSNAAALLPRLRALETAVRELADAVAAGDFDKVEARLQEGAVRRKQLCAAPASPTLQATDRVVAIDGPSASGKSTVARGVANALNALYVDSGAMYRGVTWKVLQEGLDPQAEEAVIGVLNAAMWTFDVVDGAVAFTIDGENPGEALRGEAVREAVSFVARIPEVRSFITQRIRGMRGMGKLVVEGRDIGSVIFPESKWKFYLDADPEERARRRNAELLATEEGSSVEAVLANLRKRDHIDSTRKTAPLQVAPGAQVIDTTALSLGEVIDEILSRIGSL